MYTLNMATLSTWTNLAPKPEQLHKHLESLSEVIQGHAFWITKKPTSTPYYGITV